MLGLDGTIFSRPLVNITSSATTSLPTPSAVSSSKGLATGAKVGIAIAVVLFVLGVFGFAVAACRRCLRARRLASSQERQARALAEAGQLPFTYQDNGLGYPTTAYPPTQ